MAQVGWVFLDDNGGRHRVGLYHGDRSGHLMIHCDLRVVQVDFSVLESRTYSFFIEEELCEIHLNKENRGFTYEFVVNKDVDTPHNRIRKQTDNENRLKTAVFFGIGLVIVLSLFFGIRAYNRNKVQAQLASMGINSQIDPDLEKRFVQEGKSSDARVFLVKDALQRKLFYSFATEDKKDVTGWLAIPDTGAIMLPTGFVLNDRDEFQVSYLPNDPQVHRLRFDQPTQIQVQEYMRRAALAEQMAHPQKSVRACQCLAVLTYEVRGWKALADVIQQAVPPENNPAHNRDAYLRLIRDVEFGKKLEDACGLQ